jgi:protoporphyrinogen/coproporphyrinogen III oxidase
MIPVDELNPKPPAKPVKVDVAIVGAGFSGLVVSLRLQSQKAPLSVALIDAASRPGGRIQTDRDSGFVCEWGPECIHTPLDDPCFQWLEESLSIKAITARHQAKQRYVIKDGKPVKLGPGILLSGSLLSLKARLRLLLEPFSSGPGEQEASLADFGRRRLGSESVAALLGPMCSGIFAGDPEQLSLESAFPKLFELDQSGGMVRALFRRKKTKSSRRQMVSYQHGLGELVAALEKASLSSLYLNTKIQSISSDNHRYAIATRAASGLEILFQARRWVLATPAFASASIIRDFAPPLASCLDSLAYADLAVVGLGYRAEDVTTPLQGFGALVGPDQRSRPLRSLGYLQPSQVFAGRAPRGHHLFRVMIGGVKFPELLDKSDEEIYELVEEELGQLMGLRGKAVFRRLFRHKRGIPQYLLGHKKWLETVKTCQAEHQGLYLSGSSYHGPGLADVMRDACQVGDEVAASLKSSDALTH